MRAKEFMINIPINITMNADGSVDVKHGADAEEPKDPSELDPNPVMVPPLQQDIEIKKAQAGKTSPVINDLTQDEIDPEEAEDDEEDNYPYVR